MASQLTNDMSVRRPRGGDRHRYRAFSVTVWLRETGKAGVHAALDEALFENRISRLPHLAAFPDTEARA